MDSTKNSAYLRGLLEGLKLDKSTPERELIFALVDSVTALSEDNESLRLQIEDLSEEIELLDSGINSILDLLEEEDEEEDDDCCCGGSGHCHGDSEGEKLELPCPVCGVDIDISDQMFENGRFVCPHCDAKLELDMGHGDCGCGGHGHGEHGDSGCCGH